MDLTYLVVILALGTMLAFLIFALLGKHKTEARRRKPDAPKSTLAADKSSKGEPADA